ncbi:hypothetical protein ZWY2020_050165 [Hordeum vulgare]|nr:hypothetical protein ZWY2020_050165 [Hordeum vulgare]
MAYLFSDAERVTEWPGRPPADGRRRAHPQGLPLPKPCRQGHAGASRSSRPLSLLQARAQPLLTTYECAGALVSLSSSATNARAAADAYCRMLVGGGRRWLEARSAGPSEGAVQVAPVCDGGSTRALILRQASRNSHKQRK